MEVVYHYTSPEGAFEILENRTLWFTDCQYLNDISEFTYFCEPLKAAYNKIIGERYETIEQIDDFIDSFFKSPYEDMDFDCFFRSKKIRRGFPPSYRYYVLCASVKEDIANMWNYYVKDGTYRGYNLGLDLNIIKNWFQEHNDNQIKLVAGKVIYDFHEQVNMIYCKLKELFDCYDKQIEQLGEDEDDANVIDEFQENLFEYVQNKKLFSKNPAFSSEQEYRFVLKVYNDYSKNCDDLKIKYRVGASGIITPYLEWKFGNQKDKLLKQITLSPMMEPELAKESFKRFLANDVYENIDIKSSEIKLRF